MWCLLSALDFGEGGYVWQETFMGFCCIIVRSMDIPILFLMVVTTDTHKDEGLLELLLINKNIMFLYPLA